MLEFSCLFAIASTLSKDLSTVFSSGAILAMAGFSCLFTMFAVYNKNTWLKIARVCTREVKEILKDKNLNEETLKIINRELSGIEKEVR